MDFPRGNAADFTFGTGSSGGPSPDAVAVVVQRLLGVAIELQALRRTVDIVSTVDWNSQAATAFRADLTQCDLDIAAAGRSIDDAAGSVGRYGILLATQASATLPKTLGAGSNGW